MGGGGLLELEFPGLLILRLLQVLPHTDVLVMLVLDLRLHRLQLGVELGGDGCSSEAAQQGQKAPAPSLGPEGCRLRGHQLRTGRGQVWSEAPFCCPTVSRDRILLLHCGLSPVSFSCCQHRGTFKLEGTLLVQHPLFIDEETQA